MSETPEKRSIIHLSLGGHVNRDAAYIPNIETQSRRVFLAEPGIINTYWIEDAGGTVESAKSYNRAWLKLIVHILRLTF